MGTTRAKWRANQLFFYDGTTYETVRPVAPVYFFDDFLGNVTNTDCWTVIDVGAGSTAQAASVLTITENVAGATDENGVYFKNDKPFNKSKGPIFETRMALNVAPTLGTEIIFGLMKDSLTPGAGRILVADELLVYAMFGFYTTVGAGLIPVIRTKDAGATSAITSTAVTAFSLDVYHVFRIDCTTPADIKFYVDGVGVATGTTFNVSNAADVMMQPILTAQKVGANAGLGIALFDYVRIWQATR
jgi:hypothetical protein